MQADTVFARGAFNRLAAEGIASIAGVGFTGERKKLESFTVADGFTYGNHFELQPNVGYQVKITVKIPDSNDEAHAEFQIKHP
jgi:hypothetical protein